MKLTDTINSFHKLGEDIRAFLANPQAHEEWNKAITLAEHQNGWFTRVNILLALQGISTWLHKDKLEKWLSAYPELPKENIKPKTISVVMAGNIPLVGFHDFLCVLITGNIIQAKLSSSDVILLKYITHLLVTINPELKKHIQFVDRIDSSANAVIATGSNNTARHFEYYFRNTPNIIRRNRNGIAILDGSETTEEIGNLGKDIFTYFGLGCRNVSKLYIPESYDLSELFRGIEKFQDVVNHNKYANNYTYNRTIFLMDGKVFTDNNFLAVIEDKAIPSPIAVLHFERYKDLGTLSKELVEQKDLIQCIAAKESVAKKLKNLSIPIIGLGETQSPTLSDYADGVDVIKFILNGPSKPPQ